MYREQKGKTVAGRTEHRELPCLSPLEVGWREKLLGLHGDGLGDAGVQERVVAGTLLARLGLVKMEYGWGRAKLFAGAVFCTPCL